MADFKEVLKAANDGYHNRSDYPPFAISVWDDRILWSDYLTKINDELDSKPVERTPFPNRPVTGRFAASEPNYSTPPKSEPH